MKDNQGTPFFGNPPREYDPTFFTRMFRALELNLSSMKDVGSIRVTTINVSDLPTSTTGLRSGDVWNDTGTLKVVP